MTERLFARPGGIPQHRMVEGLGPAIQIGRIAQADDFEVRLLREVGRQQFELAGKILVYEKDAHA
jgi:hypothetical protein